MSGPTEREYDKMLARMKAQAGKRQREERSGVVRQWFVTGAIIAVAIIEAAVLVAETIILWKLFV